MNNKQMMLMNRQKTGKVRNTNKAFFKFVDDQTQAKSQRKMYYEQFKRKKSLTGELLSLTLSMILQLCLTALIVFPYILLSAALRVVVYPFTFWHQDSTFLRSFINPLMQLIIILSMLFLFWKCAIDYGSFNEINHLWFLNAFYLFATQVLISTYIKSIKHRSQLKQIFTFENLFSDDNIAILIYDVESKSSKYLFDIRETERRSWKQEYNRIMRGLEVDQKAQKFNTFFSSDNNPTSYTNDGFSFLENQNGDLIVGKWQYPALSLVAFVKMVLTAFYLYQNNFHNDLIYIIVLSLFYINVTWILSKILGNYDLRRKTVILRLLNEKLVMSGDYLDYNKQLDVLSVRSLETWDNVRRAVLKYYRFQQSRLEACYVCLFFYYLFVAIACFTAYGEIYIFINKDSIYLHPIMIISNTMDFILLNIILFTRIYNGQRFNNTFFQTEERLDSLIGVTEDLLQIYDYYFNKKLDGEVINERTYLKLMDRIVEINSALPQNAQEQFQSPKLNFQQPSHNNSHVSYFHHLQNHQHERNDSHDQVISLDMSHSSSQDFLEVINPRIKQNISEVNYGPNLSNQSSDKRRNESQQSFDVPTDFWTIYDIFVAKLKYNAKFYIDNKMEFQGQLYNESIVKDLQQQMLLSAFQTLKRIKGQVQLDSQINCYQFLGMVKLIFQESLITFLLAILTVMPQILTKLYGILQSHQSQ